MSLIYYCAVHFMGGFKSGRFNAYLLIHCELHCSLNYHLTNGYVFPRHVA